MRCVMFGGFSGVVKQPKAEIGRGGVTGARREDRGVVSFGDATDAVTGEATGTVGDGYDESVMGLMKG